MAITYDAYDWYYSAFNVSSPQTASSLAIQNNDLIAHIAVFSDGLTPGTVSISSTGSVNAGDLTWTQFVNQTGGGCVIVGWWAYATATENRSFTTSWSSGNQRQLSTYTLRHSSARATNPIPAGNVFTGAGAASVSQTFTPTGTGSAYWLIAANAASVSTDSFTAGANCTEIINYAYDTHDVSIFRPTTQPRTDASNFTLSETHSGSSVSYVAFEVVSADAGGGGGGSTPKRSLLLGVG